MPSLTVRNGNDESSGKTEYGDPSRQRLQSLVMLILFLSTILFFWAGELAEGQNPVNVEAKAVKNASATYNLDEITDTVNHTGGSIEKEPCLFDSDEMADSKKGKEESIVNKVQDGIVAEEKKEVPAEEIVEEKKEDAIQKEFNSNTADNGGVCSDVCFDRRKKRTEQFGGDLLDRKDIIQLVTAEKEKMIKKLHHDYGKDNFEKMFVDNGENPNESGFRGIKPFTAGGESMKRLKRKIQIKVLSMQVLLKNSESNINGCDCTNGDKSLGKSVERTEAATAGIDTKYSKYVWATGGHSAAAGHGNMYNESYTAYMERDVKGIFESIGIEFEARNYAMGGSR